MIPVNPPPPPDRESQSLTGLSDGWLIALIIGFFCIFPPISILLVILWIIDEIRKNRP